MKNYTVLDRINTVSKPSAQNTTLCAQVNDQMTAIEAKVSAIMTSSFCSSLDKVLIDLLYTNGLRISEVLQLKSSDIDARGNVFVKGLKGSNDRLCQCTYMKSELLYLRSTNSHLFSYTNRFYYYRLFKKLGLYIVYDSNENKAVTHSLRHSYIYSLQNITNNIESTAQIVGHKNSKSTTHYYSKAAILTAKQNKK